MGAPRSPYNSPRQNVTLLHNAAESYDVHHLYLAGPSLPAVALPALVLPALILDVLADKNQ
jgi:hypothetical protein